MALSSSRKYAGSVSTSTLPSHIQASPTIIFAVVVAFDFLNELENLLLLLRHDSCRLPKASNRADSRLECREKLPKKLESAELKEWTVLEEELASLQRDPESRESCGVDPGSARLSPMQASAYRVVDPHAQMDLVAQSGTPAIISVLSSIIQSHMTI